MMVPSRHSVGRRLHELDVSFLSSSMINDGCIGSTMALDGFTVVLGLRVHFVHMRIGEIPWVCLLLLLA